MPFTANSLIVPALIFAGLLALLALSNFARRKLKKKHGRISEAFFRHLHTPVEILLVVTALYAVIESLEFRWTENKIISQAYTIAAVAVICWLAIRGVALFTAILMQKFDISRKDNMRARMVHTQIRVLRRLAISIIVLLGTASALMTFTEIRTLGVSLLASAGVAGIVIGLAAQKTIGNFFTGLQIAITQPIRIDDVVVVEGEWGRIEEINLTYVVVKIWDLRRLVLPISYFVEKPFQNWTRQSADILGAVMLYVDYTMPVQPIREEVDRILTDNPLWDGKVKVVQVTDMNDRAMEIRILVSAVDSGIAFDLRCAIREGLITFIQTHFPEHLPHFRAELPGTEYRRRPAAGPDQTDPVRAPAPTLKEKS